MPEYLALPKRILIDQDGVLANFEAGFLAAWKQKFPDRSFIPLNERRTFYVRDDYPRELRTDVEGIYTAAGFIRNLPPIIGALEALREMREAGHIIRICTSPLSKYKNCVEEKYTWVEQYLGADWVKNIILAKDKTEIRGDILIDDRPKSRGDLEPNWEYVIFDQPYNRHATNYRRLTSWANWREILK